MRKNTVRAGFVGSDFVANIYRVYGTNVEVVGIHAGDQAKAAAFADAHGGEAFADTMRCSRRSMCCTSSPLPPCMRPSQFKC